MFHVKHSDQGFARRNIFGDRLPLAERYADWLTGGAPSLLRAPAVVVPPGVVVASPVGAGADDIVVAGCLAQPMANSISTEIANPSPCLIITCPFWAPFGPARGAAA